MAQPPDKTASSQVQAFLAQVARAPLPGQRGRLVFALDATASREPSWDLACQLQGDMFTAVRDIGQLQVQLVWYRGYGEFRASPWRTDADALRREMTGVQCAGGHTQWRRVLSHLLEETGRQGVSAAVLIGDALEEPPSALTELAGRLALCGVPLFMFQEGNDPRVERCFRELARLTRGAWSRFDQNSAQTLRALLQAVAVYATGGRAALENAARARLPGAAHLLDQLPPL